jgi:predicted transcriptional regulator
MDEEHYLGIMSERDYIHKIKVLGSKQETATVKEILNGNLPVVNFEEDLNRCMVLMNVYKTRYLPVFDEFEFKGVLTMNDLMTEILEEKKYDL